MYIHIIGSSPLQAIALEADDHSVLRSAVRCDLGPHVNCQQLIPADTFVIHAVHPHLGVIDQPAATH